MVPTCRKVPSPYNQDRPVDRHHGHQEQETTEGATISASLHRRDVEQSHQGKNDVCELLGCNENNESHETEKRNQA